MLPPLTETESKVLAMMCEHFDKTSGSPRQMDIAERLGTSQSAVSHLMLRMTSKGWTRKVDSFSHVPCFYPDGRPFLLRSELLAYVSDLEKQVNDLAMRLAQVAA